MDRFTNLPIEVQNYCHFINNSKWAKEIIEKNIRYQKKNNKSLISKLIHDLRVDNNCYTFINNDENIESEEEIERFYKFEIFDILENENYIIPSDSYTSRILMLLNKLTEYDFFEKEPLVSIYSWNKFLWEITIGFWREEKINDNYYYLICLDNYYKLRTKLGRLALIHNISPLHLSPCTMIERFEPDDFDD